jgi:hypothetical protein
MDELSYMAINRNLNDLGDEETVHIPEPGGSCINWVMGHIIRPAAYCYFEPGKGHQCSVRKKVLSSSVARLR